MSRHSKWAKIKHSKGVIDAKRGALFTKLARAVTLAAHKGGDPNFNFALRLAIDAAKQQNVPKENIEKAVKRGTGELKDESQIEEVVYEAIGPGGAGLIIHTATDNKNRTVSDLKHILSRNGGALASPGAVSWQFEQKGAVHTALISEEVELALMDAGVEDIKKRDSYVEIICPPKQLPKVLETVGKFDINIEYSGLEWVAKECVPLSESDDEKLSVLLNALEEQDDVQKVFDNVCES